MEGVDLQGYIEKLFEDHHREHDLERAALQHRLEALNELRDEVTSDRQQFVLNTTYDAKHDKVVEDIRRLEREVGQIREELSAGKGRATAYAAVLTVFLVVIAIITPLIF